MSSNHLCCRSFALTCSVFLAVFGSECGGISVHCYQRTLHGNDTIGAYNVMCDLSRPLRENETVVWTFDNCTVIGKCDTRGCSKTTDGFYVSFSVRSHFLYKALNTQHPDIGSYVFAINDLGNTIVQSIISTANVIVLNCTFHPSTACDCVDAKSISNHSNEQSSSAMTYLDIDSTTIRSTKMTKDELESDCTSPTLKAFKSTSMSAGTSVKEMSSPDVSMFIYATIVLTSLFGFFSCICMCFMGCLLYRRHGRGTFRQQSGCVQQPAVNDIDIELQPGLLRPHDPNLQNGCQDFDDINDMESCSIPHTYLSLDDLEDRELCSKRHTYLSLEDSESIESCKIQHTYFSPLGNLENCAGTVVEEQVQAVDGKVLDREISSSVEGMNNETFSDDEENNNDDDDGNDGSHEVPIPLPHQYTNVNRISQRLSHKTPTTTVAIQFPSPPPLPSKYEPS